MTKDAHQLLHRLWTKAVGTADYDKAEWKRLEAHIAASTNHGAINAGSSDTLRITTASGRTVTVPAEFILAVHGVIRHAVDEEEDFNLHDVEHEDGTLAWEAMVGNEWADGETPWEAVCNLAKQIEAGNEHP